MSDRVFAPVGVVVFGVSTPFAYWGFHVVRLVVNAITDRTLHLHVSTLEQLREGFGTRDGVSVVMTSDLPDADLAAFVCESGLPLIMIADNPEVMLDWTIRSRGLDAAAAARLGSRIVSSLAPNLEAKRKLVISEAIAGAPDKIVADIIEFLWPGRGDWLAKATYEFLDESVRTPPSAEPGASEVDAESRQVALTGFASYADLTLGKLPDEIIWPLAMFTRPDGRPWTDPINLMGPARAVLYGPYFHLPVGEWTARVEFEIDGAVSGIEAVTDVRINEVVTEKTFAMPAKGIFAYELSFHVSDPHHAVEIRIFIKKSAIEGVFLPRSVRVRPQRAAP